MARIEDSVWKDKGPEFESKLGVWDGQAVIAIMQW